MIAGLHSSGTSLLGSILPACGVTMPGPLISGDDANPKGYFERSDITQLQEQLLIDLNRWWPSINGLQRLPNGWLETRAGKETANQLKSLLEEELVKQNGVWAIKDPRTSLLLPLWRRVCDQLNIPIQVLLAIRDPLEVCASLVKRDHDYTGMDGWRAQCLWWRHNIQVINDCSDIPFQVVSFSHWFSPESAQLQLKILFPSCSAEQRRQALSAIEPKHRRSHRRKQQIEIHPSIRNVYDFLHTTALQPQSRNDLARWLEQQTIPPNQPPARSWMGRLKSKWRIVVEGRDQSHLLTHPWAYFASMRRGSDPESIRRQISHWLKVGFTNQEFQHAAMLPSQTLESVNSAPSNSLVNQQRITPGPAFAKHLLYLADKKQVYDTDRERVILLRQFGINAVWAKE